ncbi:hypothetical protein JCM16303_003754 [Sporobolomyces ruberrimus]
MTSSSSSSSSSLLALKAILARPTPLELTRGDLVLLLPHLGTSTESYSLVLAILSRSTSSTVSPLTLRSIQSTLESLLSGTDSLELVHGLSLLSALLQVSPTFVSSSLFNHNDSLRSILRDAVEHISGPVNSTGKGKDKQEGEQLALVGLLSLASGQPEMRQLVAESAQEWMDSIVDGRGKDKRSSRLRALAGVGIVKLRLGKKESTGLPPPPERPSTISLEDLAKMFVELAVEGGKEDERTLLASLEGLAYLTLTPSPEIKRIASQPQLLSLLFSFAPSNKTPSTTETSTGHAASDYAIATLIDHLTLFPSVEDAQSDAAQVERLKRFASAGSRGGEASKRETVEEVTARVTLIAQHSPSPIPTLRQFCLSPSLGTRRLAGSILHSLVTPQRLRGQLLQAGVARLLLSLIRHIPSPFDVTHDLAPVQALAKLLITANPLLVFGPTPSSPLLLEATTALTLPFNMISSTPLLATFEFLMALTNIASLDPELTDKIARFQLRDKPTTSLLNAVEELLLSQNTMVRRAATELVCNLVASEPGIEYFEPRSSSTDESPSTTNAPTSTRLHLLLALSSSDDIPTRLAASGALTSLVCSPAISTSLATESKYVDLLLALLDDDEPGVRHRVYEVWRGMGEILGTTGKERDERKKAVETLREKGVGRQLELAREREDVSELRESVEGALGSIFGVLQD